MRERARGAEGEIWLFAGLLRRPLGFINLEQSGFELSARARFQRTAKRRVELRSRLNVTNRPFLAAPDLKGGIH